MSRDTNFYYSFLVLPPEKRRAIVAVWDFCRAVDDAVDELEDHDAAVREIARWRRELAACFDHQVPETCQGRALAPLIDPFHLPRESFEALIEGVEMDLPCGPCAPNPPASAKATAGPPELPKGGKVGPTGGARRYETFDDLYLYCTRVASAVGLICLEIFGYRDPRARQYATDLGVALQLTNILRDVPGDLERGRLYIPLDDLRRHECTEDDLRREMARAGGGVGSPAVKGLLRRQAVRAREYYRRAAEALPRSDARQLVAAEIMGAIYRGILDRIERADYDVFTRVVRIPRPRRALIAATTWARMAIGGTSWTSS